MKYIYLLVFLLSIVLIRVANSEEIYIDFKNKATNKIIHNPSMGVYVNLWRYKNEGSIPRDIDIVYQRFTWRDLEEGEGVYRFDKIKIFKDKWKAAGYKTAFRVMSSSVGQGTLTPDYVFDAGVPKVMHKAGNGIYAVQADPVYWHPIYLEKYSKFINALGHFLEGGSDFEFIDMGGIGIFGEMHLGLHSTGLWTLDELEKYEYSYEKYYAAYKRMIDAYKIALPNTQLFLNISRYPEIAEYAAGKGVGLRFDGLSVEGNILTRALVSGSFREFCGLENSDRPYVPCMYEFALGRNPDQKKVINALNIINKDPVSYLHLNIGTADEWSNELRDAVYAVSKYIGYRIRPLLFKIPHQWAVNGKSTIEQHWVNEGYAPVNSNIEIEMFLVTNNVASRLIVNTSGPKVREWPPSKEVVIRSDIYIPKNIKDGVYKLSYRMVIPNANNKFINFALEDNSNEYGYFICELEIKNNIVKVIRI